MQHTEPDSRITHAKKTAMDSGIDTSIQYLKTELQKQPGFYQGWLLLSKYQFEAGNAEDAIKSGGTAEKYDPLVKDFGQIQQAMQQNMHQQAESLARQMLTKIDGHPRAVFTLAHLGMLRNDPHSSIGILQEGINVSPANLMLKKLLIDAYVNAGDFAQAIDAANALVSLQVTFETLWQLIQLLLRYSQYNEVLEKCDEAAKHCFGDSKRLSQLECAKAQVLRITGDREKSVACFKSSLKHDAQNAEAWWGLADMKNYAFSDQDRMDITRCLQTPGLSPKMRAMAAFSLAKASEPVTSKAQAFAVYQKANQIAKNSHFNPANIDKEFDARIQTYSKHALKTQANEVDQNVTPIFIVGLPRSGSTLIEQILACHSQIESTIEQPTLPIIESAAQALCLKKHRQGLDTALHKLSAEDLSILGNDYLKKSALFRRDKKPFFTDKLPFNFRIIGLVHKILPHAIIIDVRRHPLDCGVSLFKQYFPSGVDFSYDLEHIGAFYLSYLRIMKHWQKVLPGRVFNIQYESLVRSPETHIRRILEHAGVEFESECMEFHNSANIVHTASSEQVRQPLNSNSIGIWREIEHSLSALTSKLGEDVLNEYQEYP